MKEIAILGVILLILSIPTYIILAEMMEGIAENNISKIENSSAKLQDDVTNSLPTTILLIAGFSIVSTILAGFGIKLR